VLDGTPTFRRFPLLPSLYSRSPDQALQPQLRAPARQLLPLAHGPPRFCLFTALLQSPFNSPLPPQHTLPSSGGDTLFSSSYAHYDALSPAMQYFLSTLTATHHAEMFRSQSLRHGFALRTDPRGAPENIGDTFRTSHPVVRTNPTTGLNGLFVNSTFTSRIDQLTFDESDALLKYLFMLQAQSHGPLLSFRRARWMKDRSDTRFRSGLADAQVRYRWNVNDLAIWDNRSTCHSTPLHLAVLSFADLCFPSNSRHVRLFRASSGRPSRLRRREALL
jgi:alpha-ketoglutarate-dependent taurine dioxygenase